MSQPDSKIVAQCPTSVYVVKNYQDAAIDPNYQPDLGNLCYLHGFV